MRTMTKGVALLACCLIATSARAQQNPTTRRPVLPQASAAKVPEDGLPTPGPPLSLDVQQLHNYSGDPIEMVVASFTPSPKGEFETTAAYNARVAVPRLARTYSFWLESGGMVRRYDADRQILKVQVPVTNCSRIGSTPNCTVSSILVKTIDLGSRPSAGSNAYSATRLIMSLSRHRYAVLVNPQNGSSLDFEIPMTPERARSDKDAVDVLVTVGPNLAPNASLIFEGAEHSPSTFSTPLEVDTKYSYLNLPLVAVWLVDSSTGRVLQKGDGRP
jgi:hypothetical protein